jgi:nicotinamide-nucleotide amidase
MHTSVAGNIEFTQIDEAIVRRAAAVIAMAKQRDLTIVTAESCTGGLLAAVLSDAPGAGQQLQGGFVTYTKQHKTIALGVPADLLARESAVSEPVARAMAEGALRHSIADVSVAITGVAGPQPDEDGNPVGLIYVGAARRGGMTLCVKHHFGEIGRGEARYRGAMEALALLERAIGYGPS